jgi:hypothetical protein
VNVVEMPPWRRNAPSVTVRALSTAGL